MLLIVSDLEREAKQLAQELTKNGRPEVVREASTLQRTLEAGEDGMRYAHALNRVVAYMREKV